jgi:hypothetical protein
VDARFDVLLEGFDDLFLGGRLASSALGGRPAVAEVYGVDVGPVQTG